MQARFFAVAQVLVLLALGCSDKPDPEPTWSRVSESEDAALLSVHGTAANDVWMAGADDGDGPLILHWDGAAWERKNSGVRGDLWWVHALPEGPVFFGGSDAAVLRLSEGNFERLRTPGLGKHTVYGIFATSPNDVYAVGSSAGRNGFIWHFDGESFREIALPQGLKQDEHRDVPGFFKVWGATAGDIWVVGGRGVVLRGNATDGFESVESGTEALLFTVHAQGDRVVIVGGESSGVVLETDGDRLVDRTPESAPLLQGACVDQQGSAWAVGMGGSIYQGNGDRFVPVDPGIDVAASHSLHAAWADPEGGVWTVGGDVLTSALDSGIALHRGRAIESLRVEPKAVPQPTCPEAAIDPVPAASIARRWNEQMLNAIRRDTPRPTVHARNLFHVSIAIWDAWAAYDELAAGYLYSERAEASDVEAARQEAISYAAYRVLSHRYRPAIGGAVSQACFDAFMRRLGYDESDLSTTGEGPRALGNRIGAAILAEFAADGANEATDYAPNEAYQSEIANLVVDVPGTPTSNPTVWQKLVLAEAVTQNGIPAGSGAQGYIGPHWGAVTPFALVRPASDLPYHDIGSPPVRLDSDLVDAAVEVIQRSAELDVEDGALMDISPGAFGNNSLGANDGSGYAENPFTGEPYASHLVRRADFGRVLAEFWADGPASETPPGHWNTLANQVGEHAAFERRLFGSGEELDALAWDARLYFALNGAVHDAAIAAWELKRVYTTARPITLIRYMGGLGQRSEPNSPSYHEQGLPLVEGLIELITEESAAPGGRHTHLSRYIGEVAVRSWRGEPGDRRNEVGGCGWIRAVEWTPYQRRTFVTPAFPGYVSGHSTFSRAAAVVLAGITGSDYFPGGFGSKTLEPGYLFFERGPTQPIELQWATYFDAADQAGQSRVWGGIHVHHDDFDGRRIGARVGGAALERARGYFDGTARQ